jgi:hypothetical protein
LRYESKVEGTLEIWKARSDLHAMLLAACVNMASEHCSSSMYGDGALRKSTLCKDTGFFSLLCGSFACLCSTYSWCVVRYLCRWAVIYAITIWECA